MGKIFFLTVFILIYGGINLYPASRIFKSLKLICHNFHPIVFAVIYSIAAITVPLSFLKRKYAVQNIIYDAGSYWMGVFVYLFLFTLAADIIYLVLKLLSVPVKQYASFSGLAIIALTVITVVFGAINAANIKVTRYEAREESLSEPLRVALISDIHIGAIGIESRLPQIVDGVNAENADIICIAGDIFNNDFSAIKNPDFVREQFSRLNATYGVYACLGNHDCGDGFEDMLELLRASGIRLLSEESELVGGKCIVVGRADGSPVSASGGARRGAFADIELENPDGLPVIVLDHNPARLGEYGKEVTYLLCGHTHKGQIFPGSLITKAMYEHDYGRYQRNADSPTVFVSSGVGYWGPPLRVGSNSEIVVIDLAPSAAE